MNFPCFPPLNIYNTSDTISKSNNVFLGLTTRCHGSLTGVTFYAGQAGTFWLDLWKRKPGETDTFVLFSSKSLMATQAGPNTVSFSEPSTVEPDLMVGVHASLTTGNTLGVGSSGYQVWITDGFEGDFSIGTTEMSAARNVLDSPKYRIPAIRLHIVPDNIPVNSNFGK